MRLRVIFLFAGSLGTCVIGIESIAQQQLATRGSKPLVAITGTDSHVNSESCERITTSEEWSRIWAHHLGRSVDDAYRPTMEVDFNRCIVVAMFRGERVQVRQVTVDSVSELSDSVIIRFSELGYGIKLDKREKPPKPERPYAFVIVPKTNKEIILEEEVQDKYAVAHGQPPRWKQWARLSPVQSAQLKE